MKVYFVRHGQTKDGENGIQQGPDIPLSESGIGQAMKVADRFRSIKVDVVYASPYPRARKTAELINEITKSEWIVSPLLEELKRPSAVVNRPLADKEVVSIKQLMHENRNDPKWHHSDEENLHDLIDRVRKFEMLLQNESRDVLVVSHAAVLKALAMLMLFPGHSSPDMFAEIYRHFRITQAGITVFEKSTKGWLLLTWNDYAHLGDDVSESFYK